MTNTATLLHTQLFKWPVMYSSPSFVFFFLISVLPSTSNVLCVCVCNSVFVSDAVFLCESHYKNVRFLVFF